MNSTNLKSFSATQNNTYTGPVGELTADITNWDIRLHDGATPGGHPINTTAIGGTNTDVQFNDSNTLGGVGTFTFDKTTNQLVVGDYSFESAVHPSGPPGKVTVASGLWLVAGATGGDLRFDATAGYGGTGYGLGDIAFNAGNGGGGPPNGGNIILTSGLGNFGSGGGSLRLFGGATSGAGGSVQFIGGSGSNGTGSFGFGGGCSFNSGVGDSGTTCGDISFINGVTNFSGAPNGIIQFGRGNGFATDNYFTIDGLGTWLLGVSNISGTMGQVITSQGAGTPPVWADPAPVYTLATLPTAIAGLMITVSDANSGAGALCYSDGSTWKDARTNATVV